MSYKKTAKKDGKKYFNKIKKKRNLLYILIFFVVLVLVGLSFYIFNDSFGEFVNKELGIEKVGITGKVVASELDSAGNLEMEMKNFKEGRGFLQGEELGIENVNQNGLSSENLDVIETSVVGDLDYKVYREQIVVGKPVRWVAVVNKTEKSDSRIRIPSDAKNVAILKGEEKVDEAIKEIELKDSPFVTNESFDNLSDGDWEPVFSSEEGLLGKVQSFFNIAGNVVGERKMIEGGELIVKDNETFVDFGEQAKEDVVAVSYVTVAPSYEELKMEDGKIVVISADDELKYTDVLAYATFDSPVEELKNKKNIRIIWHENMNLINEMANEADESSLKEFLDAGLFSDAAMATKNTVLADENLVDFVANDTDGDGYIDYVEWVVPHLSEQSYELVIETIDAQYLNKSRDVVENIYDELKESDNIVYEIPENEYIRVFFEANLTKVRDITIYADSNDSNVTVEVYEKDSDELLMVFKNISGFEKNRLIFGEENENISENWTRDVFDLKSVGGNVVYDWVVDPSGYSSAVIAAYCTDNEFQFCGLYQKGYNPHSHNINVATFNSYCSGTSTPVSMSGNCGGTVLGVWLADSRFVADHHGSVCGVNMKAATGYIGDAGDAYCNGYCTGGNCKFYNHKHPLEGTWDGDTSSYCCSYCGGYDSSGWSGEYTSNCCGDDVGENIVVSTYDSSLSVIDDTTACCNPGACVHNSGCVHYTNTADVDGNGDQDVCKTDHIWYDCTDDSHCGFGEYCNTNNDCVYIGDPSSYRFEVKNNANSNIAIIDDNGNMYLKGSVFESQSSLSPPPNSFIIENNAGTPVAYIDDSGNLKSIGTIEITSDLSGSGTKMEFRDSSDSLVAFFDNSGNLKLQGRYIEGYTF